MSTIPGLAAAPTDVPIVAPTSIAATLREGDRLELDRPEPGLTALVVLRNKAPDEANPPGCIPVNKTHDGMVEYATYPGRCWAMTWAEMDAKLAAGELKLVRAK